MRKEFLHQIRVYYKDTDCAGIVYYGKYLEFLEVARTEFLRTIGASASSVAEKYKIFFPVANVNINYKKSALLDDLLDVKTVIENPSPIKLLFQAQIFNQKGELLSDSSTLCVSVGVKSLRPEKIPAEVQALFETY